MFILLARSWGQRLRARILRIDAWSIPAGVLIAIILLAGAALFGQFVIGIGEALTVAAVLVAAIVGLAAIERKRWV